MTATKAVFLYPEMGYFFLKAGDRVVFSNEFWIQIVVYAVSIGSFAGVVLTRLKYIEKKQDKHNSLIERMVAVEQSTKSAHRRIDDLEGRIETR